MLVIAFAAATAAAQPPQPSLPPGVSVVEQARATVRIVSGARITAARQPHVAVVRDTQVRGEDGSAKTARLVEFP